MASPTLISSTSKFGIEYYRSRACRIGSCLQVKGCDKCATFSVKMAKAGFGESSNLKLQLDGYKEKLWRITPEPVKKFPWKEAGDFLVERLLVAGQKALKWSLIVLYIASFVSDFVFSVSRNQELMIPFGLLVGCLMSDFFKEVAQEMVPPSEGKKPKLILSVISCFFVLIKVVSTYFTAGRQVFLLQVSNGGLLQALWHWRNLTKENHEADEKASVI